VGSGLLGILRIKLANRSFG